MTSFIGNIIPSVIYISPFDPNSIKPTKHLSSVMSLSDAVSRAGTEWVRSLTDNMALVQAISDFYVEAEADAISFADVAVGTLDHIQSVSNTLSLTDSFIYTGTIKTTTPTPSAVSAVFDSATSKGMALYVSGSGTVDLAQADAEATKGVIGLAVDDVLIGATGNYQMEGQITLADWTAVVGSVSLTAGSFYFLDENTAGHLTANPTSTSGEYVVRVGRAVTSTTLDIEVSQPILL